jgi:metallo-beta-lactamase family protein
MASLTPLGAARTTTGSKHLLTWQGEKRTHRLLIDCGLFQGLKELRLRNWEELPVNPELIDAVILTHGHLDHVGYLPKLAQLGFDGPVYGTAATLDIAELILRDSAHIQVEDARHAKKFGYSKHDDPRPLYDENDVERVLELFKPIDYVRSYELIEGCTVRLQHAGHILGSSFVEITLMEQGRAIRVVFSGDVGRFDQPILQDPEPPTGADYFILEGTYGDRLHSDTDPLEEIADVVNRTASRGGQVVIPAFAVGRSQQLLYYLAQLIDEKKIEPIDIFLDSPMAIRVTQQLFKHPEELDLQTLLGVRQKALFRRPEMHMLQTREESMTLNDRKKPCVIISASGMATAGRILHHLARRLPDEKSTVLLVGYQGEGTRGRRLIEGEKELKIHGQMIPVKAEVVNMSSLSAHADYSEMLAWMRRMVPPSMTFLVHGEGETLDAWSKRIRNELNWETKVAELNEEISLKPVRHRPTVLIDDGEAAESGHEQKPVATATAPEIADSRGLAVIAGQGASQLPVSLSAEGLYDEPLTGELARRVLSETDSGTIIILSSDHDGDSRTFQETIEKAGRSVWRLSPVQHQ